MFESRPLDIPQGGANWMTFIVVVWTQCHVRYNLSLTEKFKLDVWYVDYVSLMTDMEVIIITFKKLIKPEGIN